jgi:hypothetical protein
MIAAYRELQDSTTDTRELDAHLEHCASCRQVFARYRSLGEQIRSISAIEPPPEMHAKLMQALAIEHTHFLQRSTSGATPPPEFLKPYLQEYMGRAPDTDPLLAFSTAETGPLPVLRERRTKRQRVQIPQLAVIGIAAMFLMAIMMGGITSLLLLGHATTSQLSTSLNQPAFIVKAPYTTTTPYDHVVSAVADSNNIYYTAYADTASNGWMLEELDRTTELSIPLLNTPVDQPLIVLGSENGWLVWLQFNVPKATNHKNPLKPGEKAVERTWSLNYLPVQTIQQLTDSGQMKPLTLASGTFNQSLVPGWVHTPIQGIWFVHNTLLVAMIDNNGTSHLVSYQIGDENKATTVDIVDAQANHVLTSPTANSDGSQIYWADEWQTDDGLMHSDVWTQLVFPAPPTSGHWANHTMTVIQPFIQNGMSFHPQVVNNTLFLLSTAPISTLTQPAATATAVGTTTATPTPASTAISNTPTISWANQAVYEAQIDEAVSGVLLSYALDGSMQQPTIINSHGQVTALQAGTRFLLWQSNDGYEMYDAVEGSAVTVGNALDGAQFLAVNGDTAVWITPPTTKAAISPAVTLDTFNWPTFNGK